MIQGISVVINTYNAEENLREVLESAKGFQEILLCDMESTDSTRLIAEEFGCRLVTFPKGENKIVEVARDYAIHSAKCEWVLVIDADELITSSLRKKVYELINQTEYNGFLIQRRNQFLGSYEKSYRKDLQLRFFRQQKTKWKPIIHSKPIVEGEVGEIEEKEAVILHLQNRSISNFIQTYDNYTNYEIKKRLEQGKTYSCVSLVTKPMFSAFKYFLLRGGYRDGKKGFLHACVIGMYDFFMVMKLLEHKIKHTKK